VLMTSTGTWMLTALALRLLVRVGFIQKIEEGYARAGNARALAELLHEGSAARARALLGCDGATRDATGHANACRPPFGPRR